MSDTVFITIQSWQVLLPLAFIFTIGLFIRAKRKSVSYTVFHYLLFGSFVVYVSAVLHLVFFPIATNSNLAPWYTSINYIPIITIDFRSFMLNVLMFLPLGIYMPLFHPKFTQLKKVILYGFLFSLVIELTQVIVHIGLKDGRISDVNDLLANTLGAFIGFWLFKRALKNQSVHHLITQVKLHRNTLN